LAPLARRRLPGGYTTFSSLEYETYRAVTDGGRWIGLANVAGSVVLGYLAVWIGAEIACGGF
jgi:CrcB protein